MKWHRLIPPAIAWRLDRKAREAREMALFQNLYQQFLMPGDLCFDIGANLGNRVKSFRSLNCTVVAVEPQSACFASLQKDFATDGSVTLIHKALGATEGEMDLHVSKDHVLSSFSSEFIKRTTESGRFAGTAWDRTEKCQVTTLDWLIREYGIPRFIKIDVEGFESMVLAGLSQPVPAVSFEWVPEIPENARACVERLAELGNYEFNVSWGESMKFSKKEWRSPESMLALVDELAGETHLFGDIYAKLLPVGGAGRSSPALIG